MAFPVNCRARVDGDVLCLDSEVAVSVDVFGEANASAVSEVSLGNELESPKGRITVYYPCGGETSWDVAKKYHVPRSELSTEKSYYLF